MTAQLEQAKQMLQQEQLSCVAVSGGKTRTSREPGIAPLLNWMEQDLHFLRGGCFADKVVGKAAALLAVHAGAEALYAPLISEAAAQCLERHNILFFFEKKVPFIENRRHDGLCPMEQACLHTDDPAQAYRILLEKTGRAAPRAEE